MARATSRKRTRCSRSSRVARNAMRSWNVYARCRPRWPEGDTISERSSDRSRVSETPRSLDTSPRVNTSATGSRASERTGSVARAGAPLWVDGASARPPPAPKHT